MSQNPGNRKANSRRKRNANKVSKPQNQQQGSQQNQAQSPSPSATAAKASAKSTAPTSRRTSRKETAQAEAKKKKQLQLIIGGVSAAVVIAIIFILVNRPTSSGVEIDYSDVEVAQSQIIQAQGTPEAAVDTSALNFSTGSTVGNPDAPVTMHIFLDFQCHFCLNFHNDTLPTLMDDFVRTGQLKLVYHDFPRLGTDPNIADPSNLLVEISDPDNESAQASHAAMCAGEQDKYLEMSDKLFGNYGGIQTGAYDRGKLDRFASDLGLDEGQFDECMDSGRYLQPIADSVAQGQANGIDATPMFILDNGSGDLNVIQQTAEGYTLIKKQIEVSIETAE